MRGMAVTTSIVNFIQADLKGLFWDTYFGILILGYKDSKVQL